jgi:AcrR family transcriptional regulator
MARPRSDARERLLAATIDHVAAHGVADLSLRTLAVAIGTSHRMLVFHFGSKEQLLVDVVRAVEARERERLTSAFAGGDVPAATLMRAWWAHLTDPAQWPQERLFFELYAQALQGKTWAAPMLDEVIDAWIGPAAAIGELLGATPEQAVAEARLSIAITRGLLLDLLATGDRAGVDAAMERWVEMYAATHPGAMIDG